jgi:hypothetical protein
MSVQPSKPVQKRVFLVRSDECKKVTPYIVSQSLWRAAESLKVPVGTRVLVRDLDIDYPMRYLTIKTKTSWRRECHIIYGPTPYDVDACWECEKLGIQYGPNVEDL